MKKIGRIFATIRNIVRGMKFVPRTIITLVAAFAALLAFSVALDTLCSLLSNYSEMAFAAAMAGGQVFLYWKDLGRIKNGLFRMAADPANDQQPVRQKKSKPAKGGAGFANVLGSFAAAFSEVPEEEEAEEDDESPEDFEDE